MFFDCLIDGVGGLIDLVGEGVAGHLFLYIALRLEFEEIIFGADDAVGVFGVVEGGVAQPGFGVEDVENNVRGFLH
jgi:hypothetical protein